jgi:DNA-binding HxlR family transcriptional regulator
VRGSDSGEPIMALLDLLGRRWALRIIWELRDGALNFRELQERCDRVSSSVLNQRLRELREAYVVLLGDDGFVLTEEGVKLLEAYPPYQAWAERWARRSAAGAEPNRGAPSADRRHAGGRAGGRG